MSNEQNENKREWLVPTITTVIGVLASIAIGWYQINLSEEQEREAEKERARSVKNELVTIVEEYIINEKALDVSTISRLAELRADQESLNSAPTTNEIIETAEFNILKSQYLEFEKKEQYKTIFDQINKSYYKEQSFDYSGAYKNSVDDLHSTIVEGNIKESTLKLHKLVSDFDSKVRELEKLNATRKVTTIDEFIKVIIEKPTYMIMFLSVYAAMLYTLVMIKRRKRRRREIEKKVMEEYQKERDELLKQKIFNESRASQ